MLLLGANENYAISLHLDQRECETQVGWQGQTILMYNQGCQAMLSLLFGAFFLTICNAKENDQNM